jgi:hypothetical protein
MLHLRGWATLGILAVTVAISAQVQDAKPTPPATAPTTPHRLSRKIQKPVELPPMPRGPLTPLPMDQIPATPAKVTYQDGMLTISAQNSSLVEILGDVRKLTGASIDIPPGSAVNERVVTNLGPGAPRDVLVGLLNGSSFNYVMVGSNSDPNAVSSVILTTKPPSSGDVRTVASAAPAPYDNTPATPDTPARPMPFRRAPFAGGPPNNGAAAANADKDDDDDKDDKDDDDDQAQPGQSNTNGQDQPQDANQPNAGPKTPEQILQMLRNPAQPGALPPNQQPPQPPQQ